MDQIFERHNLGKLRQEVYNMTMPVSIKDIKSIITSLPRQNQARMDSLVNSSKHLWEKLHQFLQSLPENG